MKRIRYTKYNGDPSSEMSLEDLLKALSEYLLDSGFQDPWSRFAELDGEHTMDNLREALRQALEAGDLFDGEMQQRIDDDQPSQAILEELKQIQGLFPQLSPISVKVSDGPEIAVSGAEFLLEGMYAHKRLSRSEERGFSAQEKATRKQERVEQDRDYDEFQEQRRSRRGFN